MATYKTQGLVLGRTNLGEADRIVIFFTPDRGQLRAVAKGVRRIKSKLAGHLEPFSEVELMLAKGKNLDIVTSARLIRHYGKVSDNLQSASLGFLMAEMVSKLTGDGEPHRGVHALLTECLNALELSQESVELYFKLKLLGELGYAPGLGNCLVCENNVLTGQGALSASSGGLVHRSCGPTEAWPVNDNDLAVWRNLLASSKPISGEASLSSLRVADGFYDFFFGKRFKAGQMLGMV